MHFDTRLLIQIYFIIYQFILCLCQYSDDQSYLSLIEFHRGGPSTNLIFSSPHGGFLGANLTSKKGAKSPSNTVPIAPLIQLPIGGCYNNTLDRCVYTLRDCLRSDDDSDQGKISFHPDARCIIDRSSTSAMYTLTKAIAETFSIQYRPFSILNKLTRQYVDPAEDLLAGTFLQESSTRVYMDYHRLIAMAKEAIRPSTRGLFIEFVFHKHSQTVQLGYGIDATRSININKLSESTIPDLISRLGSNIIKGNRSFSYFLHRNGFQHVIPLEQTRQTEHRLATYSTRSHADQRFNAILFSYPIERLRTHTIKMEAMRIAKAIEQFIQINNIRSHSSSSFTSKNSLILFLVIHVAIFLCPT